MSFTGNEGGPITPAEAAALTSNYRSKRAAGVVLGGFIGKNNITKLLDQPGCMGIRVYHGESADGTPEIVLVGADANENDILTLVIENSFKCPPSCATPNFLNSNQ